MQLIDSFTELLQNRAKGHDRMHPIACRPRTMWFAGSSGRLPSSSRFLALLKGRRKRSEREYGDPGVLQAAAPAWSDRRLSSAGIVTAAGF